MTRLLQPIKQTTVEYRKGFERTIALVWASMFYALGWIGGTVVKSYRLAVGAIVLGYKEASKLEARTQGQVQENKQ